MKDLVDKVSSEIILTDYPEIGSLKTKLLRILKLFGDKYKYWELKSIAHNLLNYQSRRVPPVLQDTLCKTCGKRAWIYCPGCYTGRCPAAWCSQECSEGDVQHDDRMCTISSRAIKLESVKNFFVCYYHDGERFRMAAALFNMGGILCHEGDFTTVLPLSVVNRTTDNAQDQEAGRTPSDFLTFVVQAAEYRVANLLFYQRGHKDTYMVLYTSHEFQTAWVTWLELRDMHPDWQPEEERQAVQGWARRLMLLVPCDEGLCEAGHGLRCVWCVT